MNNLTTLVVTRNKACHVKTLHTVLRLNLICLTKGFKHNIIFLNDDPFERAEAIMKYIKTSDRLLLLDYSIYIDNDSVEKLFMNFDGYSCLILPCVKEGVHWDKFKSKLNTTEPVEQIALEFDTTLGQKIGESLYRVTSADPKCWIAESKSVMRALREKKGGMLKLPARNTEIFERLIERGLKICAYTACRLTVTYPHECLSNILESAGVKTI
jgi:hypothetical protein